MNEINKLAYFLNCMKDVLSFKDKTDFKRKLCENNEFEMKIQKLVYLSKFFGWNNSYHFNFHINGHYYAILSTNYNKNNFLNLNQIHIPEIDLSNFKQFLENSTVDMLESESTLLYYTNSCYSSHTYYFSDALSKDFKYLKIG